MGELTGLFVVFALSCYSVGMGDLLSTSEAADLLRVTSQTIRDWVRAKRIKAVELPGGHLRIPQSEIDRILMTGERGGE